MPSHPARYEDQVFINCPFDASYYSMLRAILFAVYRCGFTPISALSYNNGLQNRLKKIEDCICSARFGIHDLSRIGLNTRKLPRFNMPFELGLFFGAKEFGAKRQRDKNAIIFDSKRYRYQSFISDLNGVDIYAHNNNPNKALKYIRDWLSDTTGRKNLPGEKLLVQQYRKFKKSVPITAKRLGFDPGDIPYNDYCVMTEDGVKLFLKEPVKK